MSPLRRPRRIKRRSGKRDKLPAMSVKTAVPDPNHLRPCVPVRGVPLKTVSIGTLIFALACLAAFVAGRPPASGAYPGVPRVVVGQSPSGSHLGHDDPRGFLRRGGGLGKTRTQKLQKGARAGTTVRFLLANPQEENKQLEDD